MGSGSSNLTNQILTYYLFHKRLELFFNCQNNPFIQNNKEGMKVEKYYIIQKELIELWKDYCNYSLHKTYLDEINFYNTNIESYITNIKDSIEKLNKELNKTDIKETFYNGIYTESNWYGKSKLQIEDFDNIIDEEAFEYFKENLDKKLASNIQGIITGDRLIIFYEKTFQIKFLYHGQTINQGVENYNSLIQLTADFSQIANGVYNIYSTQNAYIGFKKLIESNINYAFKLFDSKNINYSKKETIHFCTDTGNGNTVQYGFILRNDNLNSQTLDQTYKTVNYQQINPNKFRLIGLENVGATCYMNATLQCFFNVPTLTEYLLTPVNYMQITQNNNLYELTSAYCHLLFSVCCDESNTKFCKPQNFKDVISSKNPLFQGVNANDSKDLVNFMLEEMNQELCKLSPKINNNNNQRNNLPINQLDKYSILDLFKSDFSKNNNTIIAKNFFFITETKTKCLSCQKLKYSYQVLYLLEFPLEMVFNVCCQNNINCLNNEGKKCISLNYCFEQNRMPTDFVGENQLYCNNCSKLTNSVCLSRLYSLPKTLIIILNRGRGKAFDCLVDFPPVLDLTNYVLCPQSITKYQLTGVISHLGDSGQSGHFIAFCKHRMDKKWYRYNDALVTPCQDQNNEYKIGTPYILFYESCDKRENVLFDGQKVNYNSFIHNNTYAKNKNNMMNSNNNIMNNNMMMMNNMMNNNMMMMNNMMNNNIMNNNNMMMNNNMMNNNMLMNNNMANLDMMKMNSENNLNMNNFNNINNGNNDDFRPKTATEKGRYKKLKNQILNNNMNNNFMNNNMNNNFMNINMNNNFINNNINNNFINNNMNNNFMNNNMNNNFINNNMNNNMMNNNGMNINNGMNNQNCIWQNNNYNPNMNCMNNNMNNNNFNNFC